MHSPYALSDPKRNRIVPPAGACPHRNATLIELSRREALAGPAAGTTGTMQGGCVLLDTVPRMEAAKARPQQLDADDNPEPVTTVHERHRRGVA